MKRYEYKTIRLLSDSVASKEFEERLNELGLQGWCLISSFTQQQLGSSKYSLVGIQNNVVAVLRREI